MIPWIMVYTNIISHPKTGRLVDALGLKSPGVDPEVVAAGMLVALWTWAAQNAYHGDLTECSDRVIAQACRWKKDAGKLVQALQDCGWMDGKILHDWDEYAELYISAQENQREKTRERVRRFRNKQKSVTDEECNGYGNGYGNGYSNVTETRCNGATEQYSTEQYRNSTENNILSSFPEKERKLKKERGGFPSTTAAEERRRREEAGSDEEYLEGLLYG